MDSEISERYAQSLFELALEEGALSSYIEDVRLIDDVFTSDPAIIPFFSHILITDDVKIKLLEDSFQGQVHHYVLNFLKLLVKKRRMRYIDTIIKTFIDISHKHLGIEEGTVYSVYDLTDEQVKKIEDAISQKEKKTITLHVVIDPTLIGGIRVQIGNRVYDGSIKNKVSKLKEELLRK